MTSKASKAAAWRPTLVERRDGISSRTKFRVYADHWLTRVRHRVRPRTLALYEFTVARYLTPLDSFPVGRLTRSVIQGRVVDRMLGAGLSVATIKGALIVLSAMLTEAVDDEIVDRNAAAGLARRLGGGRPVRPPTIYEPADVARFLTTAERLKSKLAPLLALCAAGLRVGEARAIRGEDLYFDRAQLRIERTIQSTNNHVGPTKSGHARVVDLPTSCLRLLEPFAGTRGWCFPGREPGTVVSYSTVRQAMQEICEAARLPVGAPHALRHAHASTLAARGVPLLYIQRTLGHRDIKTTMHYADHLPMPRPSALDEL